MTKSLFKLTPLIHRSRTYHYHRQVQPKFPLPRYLSLSCIPGLRDLSLVSPGTLTKCWSQQSPFLISLRHCLHCSEGYKIKEVNFQLLHLLSFCFCSNRLKTLVRAFLVHLSSWYSSLPFFQQPSKQLMYECFYFPYSGQSLHLSSIQALPSFSRDHGSYGSANFQYISERS